LRDALGDRDTGIPRALRWPLGIQSVQEQQPDIQTALQVALRDALGDRDTGAPRRASAVVAAGSAVEAVGPVVVAAVDTVAVADSPGIS
jgi:hypothetical protein